jgi:hypothetical protein
VDTVENLLELRLDQALVEAAVTCRPWCDCLPQVLEVPVKVTRQLLAAADLFDIPLAVPGPSPETGIPSLENR